MTWRGMSFGVVSIYWPPRASHEVWRDLVARTSAAIRAMPQSELRLVGGDFNAENADASSSQNAGASGAWRRAAAHDFIVKVGAWDARPAGAQSATRGHRTDIFHIYRDLGGSLSEARGIGARLRVSTSCARSMARTRGMRFYALILAPREVEAPTKTLAFDDTVVLDYPDELGEGQRNTFPPMSPLLNDSGRGAQRMEGNAVRTRNRKLMHVPAQAQRRQ